MTSRAAAIPTSGPSIDSPSSPNPDPLWYKDAVIYQVHVRGFFDSNDDGVGDFQGLTAKLDYIQSLNVSCIWLQPFYPSPLRDDGYDIAHYQGVHPSYGTRRDFRHFMEQAHARGIRVITELVINHTSDQHPWFQAARRAKPGSSKRDFYVWSDTDRRYPDVRIIFTDTERSNWTWDATAGAYYWHRFFHHQPDLNFDNPNVRKAVSKVMRFWLDQGVDGMRLDAVPYLVERDGTNCENLPETHDVLKAFRRELDERYRGRMLLAEANQWPSDVRAYFGNGDECHMAFHFPLMPRLYMALQQEDRHPIDEIVNQTPEIPTDCQWAIFLRNHDELTLEMVTDEERDYMYQAYAADPQMRLNQGIRRRLAPLMENSRPRIELMTALLLSMPGTPILYYGDEIGMGDNIYLGDRNGVRTPMQWTADRNAGFSRAEPARLYAPLILDSVYGYQAVNVEAQERSPHSLLNWTRRIIALRQQHRTFGRGSMEILPADNRRVLAYVRQWEQDDPILVVANLSRTVQPVSIDLTRFAGRVPIEMSGGADFPRVGDGPYVITLGPYGYYWLVLRREATASPGVRSLEPRSATPARVSPLLVGNEWQQLLASSAREILQRRYLLPYLQRQRWFGRDDEGAVEIDDWALLRGGQEPAFLALVSIGTGADRARYLVPLGLATGEQAAMIERDAPDAIVARVAGARRGLLHGSIDGDMATRLLALFNTQGEALRFQHGRLMAERGSMLDEAMADGADALPPSRSSAEQSNSSVFFGDRLILKIIRRARRGIHPEVELGWFLGDVAHFPRVARFAGALEYHDQQDAPITLAIMHEKVKHQTDAWQHALHALARYLEHAAAWDPAGANLKDISVTRHSEVPDEARSTVGGYLETAAMLGRRTAELHLALASPEAHMRLGTAHMTRDRVDDLRQALLTDAEQVLRQLDHLPSEVPPEASLAAETICRERDAMLAAIEATVSAMPSDLLLTRIHGDFHLGQVLIHEEDAFIVDFEGEPTRPIAERRRLHSPLKDAAGMVRSFAYAAGAGLAQRSDLTPQQMNRLRVWAHWWDTWCVVNFLQAYRTTLAGSGVIPDDPVAFEAALRVFLFEKTLYETRYELSHRPAWLSIPLTGLHDLVASRTGKAADPLGPPGP